MSFIENVFKIKSKEFKKAEKDLVKINEAEAKIEKLTDEKLKEKTAYFKKLLAEGKSLNDIKIEAFAVAREATKRVLGKRLFDVQILGSLILNEGSVAEMKTGEGKTITSIPTVYLNALTGNSVIVSTVNEYLTERDAEETGKVHNFLGLTVGVNKRDMSPDEKRMAYHSDVTYSIHSEIGFDYLRDNMVKDMNEKVQRGFYYCLVDEVDSILIDEARTPLIITGGQTSSSRQYEAANAFVKSLEKEDYEIDWESKGIQLSVKGMDKANKFFGVKNIFEMNTSELVHRIQNALRANHLMFLDADYIVREGKIELIDAFTGRIMEGRSYSDGLQQAIQAKEGVEVEPETKTLATITYQNLFRMFKKLCGMTGTAKTEELEFIDIYNIRVHRIPTNRPIQRIDHPDAVYLNQEAKYKAILQDVTERNKKGQPILLGTEEVSESEKLSDMLRKANIKHTVLNAKQNESEATIISRAGEFGAITIATNMAGRGTDIQPSKESIAAGGLYVIGTNRAESRRIDNQLRGRSGRQGDIGESRFYLSLNDTLIKRFSNQPKLLEQFASYGDKLLPKAIGKFLERAQRKIEGFNFDTRKNVLQFDDVVRQQRDLMYSQRDIIISTEDQYEIAKRMMASTVRDLLEFPAFQRPDKSLDLDKLITSVNLVWFQLVDFKLKAEDLVGHTKDELIESITKDLHEVYDMLRDNVIENVGEDGLKHMERDIILMTFDQNWQVHIDQMSKLKSSTTLSHYAQKNPYQEYVEKGTELFNDLKQRISHNVVKILMQNKNAIPRVKMNAQEAQIRMAVEHALKKIDINNEDANSPEAIKQRIAESIQAQGLKNVTIVDEQPQHVEKAQELDATHKQDEIAEKIIVDELKTQVANDPMITSHAQPTDEEVVTQLPLQPGESKVEEQIKTKTIKTSNADGVKPTLKKTPAVKKVAPKTTDKESNAAKTETKNKPSKSKE